MCLVLRNCCLFCRRLARLLVFRFLLLFLYFLEIFLLLLFFLLHSLSLVFVLVLVGLLNFLFLLRCIVFGIFFLVLLLCSRLILILVILNFFRFLLFLCGLSFRKPLWPSKRTEDLLRYFITQTRNSSASPMYFFLFPVISLQQYVSPRRSSY